MGETPDNEKQDANEAGEEPTREAPTEVAETRKLPTPEDEVTEQAEAAGPAVEDGTSATARYSGIAAATSRFANNPIGRWVAVGAAVAVAFFSGLLIGRATQENSSEADLASFGRPEGSGPPMGGQVPFQDGQGFGDQQYGHEDGDSFGPPQSGDDYGNGEEGSMPQGGDQSDSSGGSTPAPLESGQS